MTTLTHPDGDLRLTPGAEGRLLIEVEPRTPGLYVSRYEWETGYPAELIDALLAVKGPGWVIDEIRRDEDPAYVQNDFRWDIFSFLDPAEFRDRDVLDFGSGCGSSAVVLDRMAPGCRITGVELLPEQADAARMRAEHHGVDARFLLSPSPESLPDDLGDFDFVLFSAVMEHLLPAERRSLLPLVWSHLKPGGVLLLNQTPHRWFPVEGHTTGLPLLNYLPDSLAGAAARKFSDRVSDDAGWEDLLRDGIRGSSESEVMSILEKAGGSPRSLRPCRGGIRDHLNLWRASADIRHGGVALSARMLMLRAVEVLTGETLVPNISLAIRKGPG